MKRVYESPVLYVEEFVANSAVAGCTIHGEGIEYTFDCMKGPNTDIATVVADSIATGCTNQIGYAAGATTARDYSVDGKRHSDNNSSTSITATWSKGTGGQEYCQVVYSGSFAGLVYADSNGRNSTPTTSNWSVVEGIVTHDKNDGGTHHMVAPVVDPNNMSSSW